MNYGDRSIHLSLLHAQLQPLRYDLTAFIQLRKIMLKMLMLMLKVSIYMPHSDTCLSGNLYSFREIRM